MQLLLHLHPIQRVLHICAVWLAAVLDWRGRAASAIQPAAQICACQDCRVPHLLAGVVPHDALVMPDTVAIDVLCNSMCGCVLQISAVLPNHSRNHPGHRHLICQLHGGIQ